MKAATDEILPAFERANGHTIRASYAPSGALVPRFLKGEPVDIFVTDAPALDELIKDGKIAGGRTDLVRTGIAIAVKKGAPKPDVSTPEALKRALLAAKSVGHAVAGRRQHHRRRMCNGCSEQARHRRRGDAEGQDVDGRAEQPRQRAGVERPGRDRFAAGVGALRQPRGRGDRHAARGIAADHAVYSAGITANAKEAATPPRR